MLDRIPTEATALIASAYEILTQLSGTPEMAGILLLVGAVLSALGARLVLAAATVLVVYEFVGRAILGAGFDFPVQMAIASLAALGLLQALLNFLFGRDTGGAVLWSMIAFVSVVAILRGPRVLLRVFRLRWFRQ